jgi:hypothetical protein
MGRWSFQSLGNMRTIRRIGSKASDRCIHSTLHRNCTEHKEDDDGSNTYTTVYRTSSPKVVAERATKHFRIAEHRFKADAVTDRERATGSSDYLTL